jgi:hypothetical protein
LCERKVLSIKHTQELVDRGLRPATRTRFDVIGQNPAGFFQRVDPSRFSNAWGEERVSRNGH